MVCFLLSVGCDDSKELCGFIRMVPDAVGVAVGAEFRVTHGENAAFVIFRHRDAALAYIVGFAVGFVRMHADGLTGLEGDLCHHVDAAAQFVLCEKVTEGRSAAFLRLPSFYIAAFRGGIDFN